MNKVILSMLLAFVGVAGAQAQKVEFGVQAGGNFSHLVYSVESAPRLGGYAGAFAQYRFGAGPWSVRLGANWESNNAVLRNLNPGEYVQSIVRYEMSMHHLAVPLSVGYTIRTGLWGGLELTPRLGIFHRWGLTSSGRLTSFLLNREGSDVPAVASVAPFDGARGEVPPSKNNIHGVYRFEPYAKSTFGILGGLDIGISEHWQVNVAYKFGSGRGITHNTLTYRGSIWLNSFELGASYIF